MGYSNRLTLCLATILFSSVAPPLAAETSPAYEIAFAGFGPLNADVFVADADGNNPRPLLAGPSFEGNASFTADGGSIIFTSRRAGSSDIYRASADGTRIESLVVHPGYDDQATLSPDGKTLAFVSDRGGTADIWLLDMRTRRLRNLTHTTGGDFRPSWSPDGKWLAFSSDRTSSSPRIPARDFTVRHSTELYIIRADGTGLRRLSRDDAYAGSPAWSPDGTHIAFYAASIAEVAKVTSARRLRGTSQIVSIDVAAGARTVITQGDGEKWSPHWTAPGKLAFVSGGPEGGVEFGDGTKRARGAFANPSWSPDGRYMVFHRDTEDRWPPN